MKARFADLSATVFPGSPADFGKFIAAENELWAKVVMFVGIKGVWLGGGLGWMMRWMG
jgi:hypothetical protein